MVGRKGYVLMEDEGWAMVDEGEIEHQLFDEGWAWAKMDEQSSINSHLLSPPLPVHPPGWAPLLRSNQTSRNAFLVFGDTFTNSQCWNSDLFSLFLLLFSTLESPCCWLHLRLRRSGSVVNKRTVILPGLNSTQCPLTHVCCTFYASNQTDQSKCVTTG